MKHNIFFEYKYGEYLLKKKEVNRLMKKLKGGFAIFRNKDLLPVYTNMSINAFESAIDGNGIKQLFVDFDYNNNIYGDYTVLLAEYQEGESQYGPAYGQVYHIEGGSYFDTVLKGEEKEIVINSLLN